MECLQGQKEEPRPNSQKEKSRNDSSQAKGCAKTNRVRCLVTIHLFKHTDTFQKESPYGFLTRKKMCAPNLLRGVLYPISTVSFPCALYQHRDEYQQLLQTWFEIVRSFKSTNETDTKPE